MSVEVEPVASRGDLREFIELPFRLHANEEQWIPPLRIERRLFLSPRFNAFFKHGEAQLFLARRDGRVVGRISAQIDTAFNDFHDNAWGMFGFLELEDDPEAARGAARRGGGLAARARPRPDGRADGLHDERRERRADRGLRARADGPPGLAPAVLPAAVRGGGARQGRGRVHVAAPHQRARQRDADHLGPGRAARAEARHPDPQDEPPPPAARPRRVRGDLQRGVVAQLGLRAVLEGRPRRVRAGAPAGATTATGS